MSGTTNRRTVRLIVLSAIVISGLAVFTSVRASRNAWELARLDQLAPAARTGADWPINSRLPAVRQIAVEYARSMLGVTYDPLMGMYGDPFGKLGLVVCIDVPVRAYQAAGVSLAGLLAQSARENPEWFNIGPNNSPRSPFFYRRVRNYFALFEKHPWLVKTDSPQAGDWAFYGKFHIALVIDASADGTFSVIEASPKRGRVAVSDSEYMRSTWGAPAFFGRLKALGDIHIGPVEMTPGFRKLFKSASGRP